jgi:hypothetical protein
MFSAVVVFEFRGGGGVPKQKASLKREHDSHAYLNATFDCVCLIKREHQTLGMEQIHMCLINYLVYFCVYLWYFIMMCIHIPETAT